MPGIVFAAAAQPRFPIGGSALSAALAASLLCLLAWVAVLAVVFFRRRELAVTTDVGDAASP